MEAGNGWAREGWRQGTSELGRNTDAARCCLVWSDHATGYNGSQQEEMKAVWICRVCGLCVCVWKGAGGYLPIFMKLFQILNIENKGSGQSVSC